MNPSPSAYDSFSSDYDRFVNWPGRLAFEMPFIESFLLQLTVPSAAPLKILDAATGTGMHVLELRRRGQRADGADFSAGMIARARANAAAANLPARFEVAGFGELAAAFHDSLPYAAVLCLGNSLPHLLDRSAIASALSDFAACLAPGGMLLLQNRNFDAVLEKKERWMEPQAHQEGDTERIFLRFYDFLPNGLIQFNILTLRRETAQAWTQALTSTLLFPLRSLELLELLSSAGFTQVHAYGSMDGSPFDPLTSPNLILTAARPR